MDSNKDDLYKFVDVSKKINSSDYIEEELQDKVLLNNNQYEKFFNITYKAEKYRPWKRKIIKITNPVENSSIHRMFFGASNLEINGNQFFVPRPSQYMIAANKAGQTFKLKKGNKFLFYWQHPFHNVRVSFKATLILGLISIILGVIAIIITIILG